MKFSDEKVWNVVKYDQDFFSMSCAAWIWLFNGWRPGMGDIEMPPIHLSVRHV